jgi:hypothetical protein
VWYRKPNRRISNGDQVKSHCRAGFEVRQISRFRRLIGSGTMPNNKARTERAFNFDATNSRSLFRLRGRRRLSFRFYLFQRCLCLPQMERCGIAVLYSGAKRAVPLISGGLMVLFQGAIKVCAKAHNHAPSCCLVALPVPSESGLNHCFLATNTYSRVYRFLPLPLYIQRAREFQ